MSLSFEHYIKLSWFIYYMKPKYIKENTSIKYIANNLLKELNNGDIFPELLTPYNESKKFLTSIKNSLSIGSLKLDKYKNSKKTGLRIAIFSRFDTAIIVFKGTTTPIEWKDNAKSIIAYDTQIQKDSKKFVDEIINSNKYSNIITIGHSKGGNLAQYVTIKCDKINKAISINGNGFSNNFCSEYSNLIDKNKDKIYEINADHDVVSQILNHITDHIKIIDSSTSLIKSHLPLTLLENGKLKAKSYVSKTLQNWHKFTINVSRKFPKIAFGMANCLTFIAIISQKFLIHIFDIFNKSV